MHGIPNKIHLINMLFIYSSTHVKAPHLIKTCGVIWKYIQVRFPYHTNVAFETYILNKTVCMLNDVSFTKL